MKSNLSHAHYGCLSLSHSRANQRLCFGCLGSLSLASPLLTTWKGLLSAPPWHLFFFALLPLHVKAGKKGREKAHANFGKVHRDLPAKLRAKLKTNTNTENGDFLTKIVASLKSWMDLFVSHTMILLWLQSVSMKTHQWNGKERLHIKLFQRHPTPKNQCMVIIHKSSFE